MPNIDKDCLSLYSVYRHCKEWMFLLWKHSGLLETAGLFEGKG